eukprot:SAG31_NODE_3499_length_4193_cov_2.250611_3_plen_102_part_00
MFMNEVPGWDCIVKHRYADFIVQVSDDPRALSAHEGHAHFSRLMLSNVRFRGRQSGSRQIRQRDRSATYLEARTHSAILSWGRAVPCLLDPPVQQVSAVLD